jgi:hypothetical protein
VRLERLLRDCFDHDHDRGGKFDLVSRDAADLKISSKCARTQPISRFFASSNDHVGLSAIWGAFL